MQRRYQGKCFKNRPKNILRLKGPKALWRKCNYPLISMPLNCKDGKRFGASSGSKTAQMAKLWQFSQSHPKPAFSEKVQTGDQGKFFKNRPKNIPRLKGPKALWGRCHYPVFKMYLNGKNWRIFWSKQRLQKCPNG